MKHILTTLWLVVGTWLTTAAANTLSVSTGQGRPGEEVQVTVSLAAETLPTAVEVRLPIPEALRYVEGSAAFNAERGQGHSFMAAVRDGVLSVVVYSPTLHTLQGADGELFSFALKMRQEPGHYALSPEVVMSDAAGTTLPCQVQGGTVTLLAPKMEVVTASTDFGSVPIRSTYTRNLTVRNVGTEALHISEVIIQRNDLTADAASYTLAPGSTQNIVLTYRPMVHGAMETTVQLTHNGMNPGVGSMQVLASPYSVNELHVQRAEGRAGQEVTVQLKMNNMEPIAGAQCEFVLPKELVYVDGSAAVGSRCTGTDHKVSGFVQGNRLNLLLYSNQNQTLPEGDGELMSFKVLLKGYSGSYKLTPQGVVLSNAGAQNMVSATSANYVVVRSPKVNGSARLNLPDMPVEQTTKVSYTLRNNGNDTLVVNRVNFLGEGFSYEGELPLVIIPWGSKTLNISVVPTKEGACAGTLQIYTNDPLVPIHNVALSGLAYEHNALSLSGQNVGDDFRFVVHMNNYSRVSALQMTLKGVPHMNTRRELLTPAERLKNHTVMLTDIGDDSYQVLIYSMNNAPIERNSGELFSVVYEPEEGAGKQSSTLAVTDVVLSHVDGTAKRMALPAVFSVRYTHFDLTYVLGGDTISQSVEEAGAALQHPAMPERLGYTFRWVDAPDVMPAENLVVMGSYFPEFTMGDVNHDGEINIADAIGVVNFVLKKGSAAFVEAAADVNGDEKVDIADAIAIVNVILKKE